MSLAALKPCPFCGGPAEHRESHGWHGIGCNTDKCPALLHALMFRTEADAKQVWNRRTAGVPVSTLLDLDGLGMHAVQFGTEAQEIAALRAELARLARPSGVMAGPNMNTRELAQQLEELRRKHWTHWRPEENSLVNRVVTYLLGEGASGVAPSQTSTWEELDEPVPAGVQASHELSNNGGNDAA